jgi:hypothetical protein
VPLYVLPQQQQANMGENQGIEVVLGKLVELLAAKKDDTTSSSKEIGSYDDTLSIQKLGLMPNDVKLEGVKNYLAWSRRAVLLLKAKGLEGLVNGKLTEPADHSSVDWRN